MSMSVSGFGTAHGEANVTISSAHARSSAGSNSCGSLQSSLARTGTPCCGPDPHQVWPRRGLVSNRKKEQAAGCSEGLDQYIFQGNSAPTSPLFLYTSTRIPVAGEEWWNSVTCCCRATRNAPVTAGVASPEKIWWSAATASSGTSLRFCSTIACRASRTAILANLDWEILVLTTVKVVSAAT